MFLRARKRLSLGILGLCGLVSASPTTAQGPTAGQNINMVSGTDWTNGDPFLQRQNEPSIAVSTRNPCHLLAGANDYRAVDLETLVLGEETGDAWLGVFKSTDCGATWRSTLMPGYPGDSSPDGRAAVINGLQAAADPTVRAGAAGMLYYSGLVFDRGTGAPSDVFVARYIDNDNKENGDPGFETGGNMTNLAPRDTIRYLGQALIDTGTTGQFLDKPALAVDVPRSGTCNIAFANPDGSKGTESIPAGTVYIGYARFTGNQTFPHTQILITRSSSCGAKWDQIIKVSESNSVNQGTVIAVDPSIPTSSRAVLYVAWRRFAVTNASDAILIAPSTDGGGSFGKSIVAHAFPMSCMTAPTGLGCAFDQSSTVRSFRTNGYATMAVDNSGRVYLAWAERGCPECKPAITASTDARIVMSTSVNGGATWSTPFVVDNGSVTDDSGTPFRNLSGRGNQVMPSLTFNAGLLTLTWYDLREDHTLGNFALNGDRSTYTESRQFAGELSDTDTADPSVFNPFICDKVSGDALCDNISPLTTRRHTIDVQGAQATPGATPNFVPFRISRYLFGLLPSDLAGATAHQLQMNVPNLPLFRKGTTPFMGDYIDVAGPTFVLSGGNWMFNSTATQSPVFHAVWTDNRDVRPPHDGDWTNYTPPFSASATNLGAKACQSGQAGMRDQNIYTSEITQGLLAYSPGNSKRLGFIPGTNQLLQRTFAAVVQNLTNVQKSFRLTIQNQPAGTPGDVFASFQQFIGSTTPPLTPPHPLPVTQLAVTLNAQSGASRPVFVISDNPTATVTASINEVSGVDPISNPFGTLVTNGLSSFVVLNPDPTAPPNLDPDGFSGTSVNVAEIYNPTIGNPTIGNPTIGNPTIGNPTIGNPTIGNPTIGNATLNTSIPNPSFVAAIGNPTIGNPTIGNPTIGNPTIGNPTIGNQSVTDANYTATNVGNTTANYSVKLFQTGAIPSNVELQLILSKLYLTPTESACNLNFQMQNIVLASIPNPTFTAAADLGNPTIGNPDPTNATLALAPGETGVITIRANVNSVADMQSLVNNFTVVGVSQAVNTTDASAGTTTPPVSLLLITNTLPGFSNALPDGVTGVTYSAMLTAIGGAGARTWSVSSGFPGGLTVNPSTGVISGTPTSAGNFFFTATVMDSANTATANLEIRIAAPLVVTTTGPLTAIQNVAFSQNLSATGGIPPVMWSLIGAFPNGLSLSSSGLISWTPTVTGTFNFTVQVSDSAFPTPSTKQQPLSITVLNHAAVFTSAASSLSILVSGTNVVSYVPKGHWGSGGTGVSIVNVEGTSVTPTAISTPSVVNSCASNSVTLQTVCTANNTDVYLLSGTTLNNTLTSGGSGTISFSGGSCTNCGVAMDAVNNRAVIGLSLPPVGTFGTPGFQFLNLGSTPSFETAFTSPSGQISEDPIIDPIRNLVLSAAENNQYEIVNVATSTSPAFFENPVSVVGTGLSGLDSSGEDYTTGIALAPIEASSNNPSSSSVYIADLTQATLTSGSPAGTWTTAASQVQILSEATLTFGANGIAVAQGTHTGVVTGEFGGNNLTAIALPTTSGSGTPAITDWVTCNIGGSFSNGKDPHTVNAYQSPNGGHAIAVLANDGATTLAVVDLTRMLDPTIVPRTTGTGNGHGCASGTLPATVVSSVSVP